MKSILVSALCVSLLTACSTKEVKPEEEVLKAATAYYEDLLKGDYAGFTKTSKEGDSIADDYRSQLELSMRMYAEHLRKQNGGIVKIEPVKAKADTAKHEGEAYLEIVYADSTREEIVVPMVLRQGVWYMK